MFAGSSDPEKTALTIWQRDNEGNEGEWDIFCELGAACLSDTVANILDSIPPEKWGKVLTDELNVIDHLLAKVSSEYVILSPTNSSLLSNGIDLES
jgi:hypothetical protein